MTDTRADYESRLRARVARAHPNQRWWWQRRRMQRDLERALGNMNLGFWLADLADRLEETP